MTVHIVGAEVLKDVYAHPSKWGKVKGGRLVKGRFFVIDFNKIGQIRHDGRKSIQDGRSG